MNRHEECIHDGVDKLHTAAQLIASLTNSKIVKVTMGLHVYNVLVLLAFAERGVPINPEYLAQPEPTSGEAFKWFDYPCEIDREDHNAMPVFMFIEKTDRDENTLDIEDLIKETMQ